jgi:hypothetical protein
MTSEVESSTVGAADSLHACGDRIDILEWLQRVSRTGCAQKGLPSRQSHEKASDLVVVGGCPFEARLLREP